MGGFKVPTSIQTPDEEAKHRLNRIIDQDRDKLIESVQELVRIRSVKGDPKPSSPFGEGPAKALDKALEIAKDLGFRAANLDGYIGYAEHGSGEDYVAVLGHLDVVPEGDGWEHPPYSAEIHEGKIYGRGTTDDKGPAIAALYALKALRDSGLPISKKVRVMFGTDEESDNADVSYYLKREKPPFTGFTPDAFYPLVYAEKGIINFDIFRDLFEKTSGVEIHNIRGGVAANMVPDLAEAEFTNSDVDGLIRSCIEFADKTGYDIKAEKLGDSVVIKSIGVAAHGSTPEEGKNAIMQLMSFLGTLPLDDSSDISKAIYSINKMVDMETDGSSMGLALEDKPSGKLSLNLGLVNMTDEKIIFTINLRYPVTFEFDDVINPLKQIIKDHGFWVENLKNHNPLYFPVNSPLVKTLLNVFNEHTGSEEKPLAIGGGTYAKEMPNIVAFGPIFPGEPMVEHKPNEYIKIDELVLSTKIYADALYQLAK